MVKIEFFRVLPVILLFIAVAFALSEKNHGWMLMVVGLVLNGLLWYIVSSWFMRYHHELAKRPQTSQCYFFHQKTLTSDNGMPSGHCQSAAFFGTWLVLMAIFYGVNIIWYLVTISIAAFITVGMIWSRVKYYKCHNAMQAGVGTAIGCITAFLLYPILLILQ